MVFSLVCALYSQQPDQSATRVLYCRVWVGAGRFSGAQLPSKKRHCIPDRVEFEVICCCPLVEKARTLRTHIEGKRSNRMSILLLVRGDFHTPHEASRWGGDYAALVLPVVLSLLTQIKGSRAIRKALTGEINFGEFCYGLTKSYVSRFFFGYFAIRIQLVHVILLSLLSRHMVDSASCNTLLPLASFLGVPIGVVSRFHTVVALVAGVLELLPLAGALLVAACHGDLAYYCCRCCWLHWE